LPLFHHCPEATMHFPDRHLLLHRGHTPCVSEWIEQGSLAVSIELVRDGACQLGTRRHSVLREGIRVRNVDPHADWRTAPRLRAVPSPFRPLVAEHDDRISNHDLSMRDTRSRVEAHGFSRPEGLLIKFDCFCRILESQPRGCEGASCSDGFCCSCHCNTPFQIIF